MTRAALAGPSATPPARLVALAPAKLNFGLRIVRRRADGYHDILTRFQAVDLFDRLTVEPRARGWRLSCSDPTLTTGPDNLVLRAARALAAETGVGSGAAFHLEKHIPHGAGLGGGSSDAAAALLLLCRLWKVRPPRARLARLARSIGSDVPYFLVGGGAIGRGRGDRLTPLPSGPCRHVVIVHSRHRIAAKWAYLQYRRELTGPRTLHRMSQKMAHGRRSGNILNSLTNDLEPVVVAHYPDLRRNLDQLRVLGAVASAMTGSGSSVYGLFPDRSTAAAAARRLGREGGAITLCRTIPQGVIILES